MIDRLTATVVCLATARAGQAPNGSLAGAKSPKRLKVNLKSKALRRRLRAGRRYLLEVTPGTARNRLGKATRRTFRVRR